MLLGQDLLIALRLALPLPAPRTQALLAAELSLSSPSVVAHSLQRLRKSSLVAPESMQVRTQNLHELLVHGLKYFYPVIGGGQALGVPTGLSVVPLVPGSPTQVWPDARGTTRGEAVSPLHPTVPRAALADRTLHEALALVDILRMGRARERQLAAARLRDLVFRG